MTSPTPDHDQSHKIDEGNDNNYNAALSLSHAMKMADNIRKHFLNEKAQSSSLSSSYSADGASSASISIPPGVLEGAAAFIIAGVSLLPVRRLILHQSRSHQGFHHFMDLTLSVGHTLAATQVGLMAGSIFGGRAYLEEFNQISPYADSPVADQICDTMWKTVLPLSSLSSSTTSLFVHEQPNMTNNNIIIRQDFQNGSSSSWDPRIQTMRSLLQTIENCRRRESYKESSGSYR